MSVDLETELAELGARWNATVPHIQPSEVFGVDTYADRDAAMQLDEWAAPPPVRARSRNWVIAVAAVFVVLLGGGLVVESTTRRDADVPPSDSATLPTSSGTVAIPLVEGIPTLDAQPVSPGVPLVVNKGSSDGLVVGMPVVNADGLVGKIMSVTSDQSVVMLVNDVKFAVGARVDGETESETEFGAVEGHGAGLPLRLRFIHAPSAENVEVGDVLVTAGGTESLAPAGIPIGTVTSRVPPPSKGTDSVSFEVEPYAEVPPTDAVKILLYRPGDSIALRPLETIQPGEVAAPSTVAAGWTVEPVISESEPRLHWEFTDPSRGALGTVWVLNESVRNEGNISRNVTLNGNTWSVEETGISSTYSLDLGNTYISVGGNGFDTAELESFIAGLRAGPESAHPGGSFDPSTGGVVVAQSGDDLALSAAMVNDRMCWAVREPEGSYVAQCARDLFDVDLSPRTELADGTALLHVGETQQIHTEPNGESTVLETLVVVAGITDPAVQSVDVTMSDGVVLTVPTSDLSGQFETRFFLTRIAVPGDTQEPGPVTSVTITPGTVEASDANGAGTNGE